MCVNRKIFSNRKKWPDHSIGGSRLENHHEFGSVISFLCLGHKA